MCRSRGEAALDDFVASAESHQAHGASVYARKNDPPALDSRSAVAWGDPYDSQESFRLTASAPGHHDRCGAGARCYR